VDLRRVDRAGGVAVAVGAQQEREALAERDVAGGVLVQQRVVEDGLELTDAALAVDQRDLADPRRPSSRAQIVRIVSAAVSASICTARPPSKRTLRLRTTVPSCSTSGFVELTVPSTRAGSGEVNTSSVGMFGMCTRPSARSKRAAASARCAAGRP
jgi:hypothetical protein